MILIHFFVPRIAHSSYILAGNRTCAVVDPSRDVDRYIKAADELDLEIRYVMETHLHADFVSGHMDLAAATGAEIVAPRSAGCAFPHTPVSRGDHLMLEDMRIDVIETPGHTPEHVSYTVTDTSRAEEPVGVFCGDTLFVGDVGRPDLFPGRARELASSLFDSLKLLLELPDYCEVYPAHGAGSLCGRAMGAKWRTTIGFERRHNPALAILDREEFITSLTSNMPPAPDHFARCSDINRAGPSELRDLKTPVPMKPDEFRSTSEGSVILDTRRFDAFGGQHVPGSWSFDGEGNLPTFAGWVIPPDRDIYLVTDGPDSARESAMWLHRVGLDRIVGWLDGGMFAWSTSGLPAGHLPQFSAIEADEAFRSGGFQLIDVRAAGEFEDSHVQGALNIPAPDMRDRWRELDPDGKYILMCSTGHRSSLAAGILLSRGFRNLWNVAGGMRGYSAAALAPACMMCSLPHGPKLLVRKMGDGSMTTLSGDR